MDTSNKKWHQPRTYRSKIQHPALISYNVIAQETDLFILADKDYSSITLGIVNNYRNIIEKYINHRHDFKVSLEPVSEDAFAPSIIRDMIDSTRKVGVGPMASVAGAIAQYVGQDLLQISDEVIVENGGDNYLKSNTDLNVGVFAGSSSPFKDKLVLKIKASDMPLGICTSSGTIGHSFSMGRADAVCVISKSAILADASATAIGNRVKTETDIRSAIEYGISIEGILGILIAIRSKMGAAGSIELC